MWNFDDCNLRAAKFAKSCSFSLFQTSVPDDEPVPASDSNIPRPTEEEPADEEGPADEVEPASRATPEERVKTLVFDGAGLGTSCWRWVPRRSPCVTCGLSWSPQTSSSRTLPI